jgi:membrane protein DedA with SNARE-associated domain/rhodanese-related sulfurtransferase
MIMDGTWLARQLEQESGLIVFINVFLQQLGLPLPAVPTMLLAGSKSPNANALMILLLAAVLASLIADWIWYLAGRKYGFRVLSLLCKLSINPGSCVNQTEARFAKWGVWALVFGKFIPGFSTVAPPIAGVIGMRAGVFLLASSLGAALWAGLALLAGAILHKQITLVMDSLTGHGVRLAGLLALIVVLWIGWKHWQKWRFMRRARMSRVSARQVMEARNSVRPFHILDLRNQALIELTGTIAQAHVTKYEALSASLSDLPKDYPIVTLCACPQDAGAIQAAGKLQQMGYENVLPLHGGFEAWQELAQKYPELLIKPAHSQSNKIK